MRLSVGSGRTLAEEKGAALAAIDAAAGAARARYITVTAGQAETYAAKAGCAQAYKDAGYPLPCDAAAYPWIAAEAEATGTTPRARADFILATRDAWTAKGVEIEAARMGWKAAIEAKATNAEVVRARLDAVAALGEM